MAHLFSRSRVATAVNLTKRWRVCWVWAFGEDLVNARWMDPSIFSNKVDPWNEWNLSYHLVFFLTWIETKDLNPGHQLANPFVCPPIQAFHEVGPSPFNLQVLPSFHNTMGRYELPGKIMNFCRGKEWIAVSHLECWNLVHGVNYHFPRLVEWNCMQPAPFQICKW